MSKTDSIVEALSKPALELVQTASKETPGRVYHTVVLVVEVNLDNAEMRASTFSTMPAEPTAEILYAEVLHQAAKASIEATTALKPEP